MEQDVKQIKADVQKLDGKFDRLNDEFRRHQLEPAENWNKLKWLVISTLVVAIIGLIVTLVGLKP